MIQPRIVCVVDLAVGALTDLPNHQKMAPGTAFTGRWCGGDVRQSRRWPGPTLRRGGNRGGGFVDWRFVNLRAMDLGDLRNQTKLADQCPRFLVLGGTFEGVPVDRFAIGD